VQKFYWKSSDSSICEKVEKKIGRKILRRRDLFIPLNEGIGILKKFLTRTSLSGAPKGSILEGTSSF
jgi:hypothetical protein